VRLFVAVLVLATCAHVPEPVQSCASQVTPELTATAGAALAGVDYEDAIARELGGLAACLVVAAVEAAVRDARSLKLSSPGFGQSAIAIHGDAWLAKHKPPPASKAPPSRGE
jgi:hypothetical protein